MSPQQIIFGLSVVALFIVGAFVAVWHLNVPASVLVIAIMAVAAIFGVVACEIERRKALRPYWERPCTGALWKRRFPQASKADIRSFLDVVVAAFGFSSQRRLCFTPDDKVLAIYHSLFPPGMEFEDLVLNMTERYRIDLEIPWPEDITLGDLYEKAKPKG